MTNEDQPKDTPSHQFIRPKGIPSNEAVGTPSVTIADIQEAFPNEDLSGLKDSDIEVSDKLPTTLGEAKSLRFLGPKDGVWVWVKEKGGKIIKVCLFWFGLYQLFQATTDVLFQEHCPT